MSTSHIEQLTSPSFIADLTSLTIEEIRNRRASCQDTEEALSLHRRLVQGRLDIVQAELYRRGGGEISDQGLVESLPDILVEHGDRHLGPGRLTSVDTGETSLGVNFEEFTESLDRIVDGAKLSNLPNEEESSLRRMAEELDELERAISKQRHQLHHNIDAIQEEIVRRYRSGEVTVDSLLES